MYDLNSNNPNPVINYDGVSKNITSVGFHEDGRWMYTGGEDCMARIWDLRYFQLNSLCSLNTSTLNLANLNFDPSSQVKKSAVSEDIPGQCSNQLCMPASQPGETLHTESWVGSDTIVYMLF